MFWHFLISCSRVKIVLTFIHHNHVIFYLEAKSHIRFIQHSAIVNTCSPCHAGRLDHMNSVHKWLLETKLDFIGLSVSVCACVLASVRVFCDIMSLRSHSQDCRGCCHGSGFWRPLFHDRGRWKKKTLYRVTHPENIPVFRQTSHSVTVSVHACMYMCLWIYRKASCHINEPNDSDTRRASENEQTQLRER